MTRPQQAQSKSSAKTIAFPIVAIILLCTAYLFGAYSYPRNIWPIELLRKIKSQNQLAPSLENYDRFGRFIKLSNKTQVSCPPQTNDTAVLLAIGQSNSANHAEQRLSTQYPQQVFNYFEGKCYVASSPLLGATGEEGEFITPLADKLITDGVYKSVVIVSSGIGGTPIARWQQDGDLNEMLLATLLPLQKQYKITDIVWHQGESDSKQHFRKSLRKII